MGFALLAAAISASCIGEAEPDGDASPGTTDAGDAAHFVRDGGRSDDSGGEQTLDQVFEDGEPSPQDTEPAAHICEAYCRAMFENCDGEQLFKDTTCHEECEPFWSTSPPCFRVPETCAQEGDTLECRLYHATVAGEAGDEHCQTAAIESTAGPCASE